MLKNPPNTFQELTIRDQLHKTPIGVTRNQSANKTNDVKCVNSHQTVKLRVRCKDDPILLPKLSPLNKSNGATHRTQTFRRTCSPFMKISKSIPMPLVQRSKKTQHQLHNGQNWGHDPSDIRPYARLLTHEVNLAFLVGLSFQLTTTMGSVGYAPTASLSLSSS